MSYSVHTNRTIYNEVAMDNQDMGNYSTEKIFENVKNREKAPPDRVMYDPSMARKEKDKLRRDIENYINRHDNCSSETDFIVNKAGITKSQFSRFMNSDGTRGLSRDSILKIFIVLGYNIDYIRTLLHRFGLPDLYPRDRRDYLIIKGVIEGKSLTDIDEKLDSEGFETLWKASR